MHHKTLLRWIAEAEARWVRSFAVLIREASEPHVCIVAAAAPPRLVPMYRVAARLGRLVRSRGGGRRQALPPVARLTREE